MSTLSDKQKANFDKFLVAGITPEKLHAHYKGISFYGDKVSGSSSQLFSDYKDYYNANLGEQLPVVQEEVPQHVDEVTGQVSASVTPTRSSSTPDQLWLQQHEDVVLHDKRIRPVNVGWRDKMDAAWREYSATQAVVNLGEKEAWRENSNVNKQEITADVLLEEVPEDLAATVLQEQAEYGDAAALALKAQITASVRRRSIIDDMPWYAQLGYGAVAYVADPLAWVAAGPALKVGAGVSKVAGSLQRFTPPGTSADIATRFTATAAGWSATAATEEALIGGIRLGGNPVYSKKEYMMDIGMASVLGATLGTGAAALRHGQQFNKYKAQARDAAIADMQNSSGEKVRQMSGDITGFNTIEGSQGTMKAWLDGGKVFDGAEPTYVSSARGIDAAPIKLMTRPDQVKMQRDRFTGEISPTTEEGARVLEMLQAGDTNPRMTTNAWFDDVADAGGSAVSADVGKLASKLMNTQVQGANNVEGKWLLQGIKDYVNQVMFNERAIARMRENIDLEGLQSAYRFEYDARLREVGTTMAKLNNKLRETTSTNELADMMVEIGEASNDLTYMRMEFEDNQVFTRQRAIDQAFDEQSVLDTTNIEQGIATADLSGVSNRFQKLVEQNRTEWLRERIPDAYREMYLAYDKVTSQRAQAASDGINRIAVAGDSLPLFPTSNLNSMDSMTYTTVSTGIRNNPNAKPKTSLERRQFNEGYGWLMEHTDKLQVYSRGDAATAEAWEQLALTVSRIGMFYPNGVPANVNKAIKNMTHVKRMTKTNNFIKSVLDGGEVSNVTVQSLVKALAKRTNVKPADLPNKTLDDLYKLYSNNYVQAADATDNLADAHLALKKAMDEMHVKDASMIDASDEYFRAKELLGNKDALVERATDATFLEDFMEVQNILTGKPDIEPELAQHLLNYVYKLADDKVNKVDLPVGIVESKIPFTAEEIRQIANKRGLETGSQERKDFIAKMRKVVHRTRGKEYENTAEWRKKMSSTDEGTNYLGLFPEELTFALPDSLNAGVTVESITRLNKALIDQITNPRQITWQAKASYTQFKARLTSAYNSLLDNQTETISRAVMNGDVVELSDILTAQQRMNERIKLYNKNLAREAEVAKAHADMKARHAYREASDVEIAGAYGDNDTGTVNMLLAERYLAEARFRSPVPEQVEIRPKKELVNAVTDNHSLKTEDVRTAEETITNPADVSKVAKEMADVSMRKVTKAIDDFATHDQKLLEIAVKPRSIQGYVGQWMGRALGLTEELAETFIRNKSTTMQYIGSHLTELGKGFGGNLMRKHTAAVIREAEANKSLAQVLPSYTKTIDQWAVLQGAGVVRRVASNTRAGVDDPIVNEFNRAFMTWMNNRKLGRANNASTKEGALLNKFAEDWERYMAHNHSRLVEAGAGGFKAGKVRKNYVPQIWQTEKLKKAHADNPALVEEVLALGYQRAGVAEPKQVAASLLEWANTPKNAADEFATDTFMPRFDSRAKERIQIDWSAEVDGLSVMDLLDVEVAGMASKYSNRVGGWVGISKATNGAISDNLDISSMRNMVDVETNGDAKALQDYDDVIDALFGRPVRGGMPQWARAMRDATTLTRMGGMGTAQAIESGSVLTRGLLETVSDPKFMKKVTKGLSEQEAATDLKELMRMSGYDWDFEYLHRQSVHLDQSVVADHKTLGGYANKVAEFATFGSMKAPAARLLNKVNGYNAVRKYQSAVLQRSFGFAVARHFKFGSSKMSTRRMADLGLSDIDGTNPVLKDAIDTHVRFDADGYPTKYNFENWSKEALETFQYALQRAEAQDLVKALVGETPRWLNRPAMQIAAQFRNIPIISQNKLLARNMMFGDREAVTQLALNVMTAGVIRSAKIAGLAAMYAGVRNTEFADEFDRKLKNTGLESATPGAMDKYINALGIWPEVYSLSVIGQSVIAGTTDPDTAVYQQVPMLGLVEDVYKTGKSVSEQDLDKSIKNAQGITYLGNTAMMDFVFTLLEEQAKEE